MNGSCLLALVAALTFYGGGFHSFVRTTEIKCGPTMMNYNSDSN